MTLSDFLSFLAISVSIYTIFRQTRVDKEINDINLSIPFFEKIYFEALTQNIPNAQDAIYYDSKEKKIAGTSDMKSALREVRKNERFFQYSNTEFFDKVKNKSMQLDELLSKNVNIDKGDYLKFEESLEKDLIELYDLILSEYKKTKSHQY